MLWAEVEVIYFGLDRDREDKYYNSEAVLSLALKFSNDLRVLGFVRGNTPAKYTWNEKYNITIIIPSINANRFALIEDDLEQHQYLDICAGSRTVGQILFLTWRMIADDSDEANQLRRFQNSCSESHP